MRYRITENILDRRMIVLDDVLTSDEILADGSRERYGLKLTKIMKRTTFELKLFKAIFFCRTILNFECRDGIYYIDWIEVQDNHSILHQDSFLVEDESYGELTSMMNRAIKVYKAKEVKTKRKIAKIADKYPFEVSIYGELVALLSTVTYKEKGDLIGKINVDSLDPKLAAEMYDFSEKNKTLFENYPVVHSAFVRHCSFLLNILFAEYKIMIGFTVVLNLLTLNILFAILFLFIGINGYSIFTKFYDATLLKYDKIGFDGVLKELAEMMDKSHYEELQNRIESEQKRYSFNDLIQKDKKIAWERFKSSLDEFDLEGLNQEYTFDKIAEMQGDGEVDKAVYLGRLFALEKKMYAQNKRLGLMKTAPSVGMEDFYAVLAFLGIDKKEALTDEFMRYVYSSMRGIFEHAYEGCEVELISMLEVAIDYIGKGGTESEEETKARIKIEVWKKKVDDIFMVAEGKVQDATKLESMADAVIEEKKTVECDRVTLDEAKEKRIDLKI